MVSDSLARQRALAKEQARLYQSVRKQTHAITSNPYLTTEMRSSYLRDHQEKARQALADLRARREAAHADLVRLAGQRKAQPTPESTAKVQRLLDRGWTFSDLAVQLVSDGDRPGLASLSQELSYLSKEGKLPGSGPRALDEARRLLAAQESRLYDGTEQRWHQELRESEISQPLMQANEKKIGDLIDAQSLSQGHTRRIDNLFHWQGPAGEGPRGLLDPNVESEV